MNEQMFRNLASGQTRGIAASCLRATLLGASWAYGFGVGVRNSLFDSGWKSIQRVTVPVFSLGNITTGGTGKTPLVALVCQLLQESDRRPGIVSRGYRSVDGDANDEKLVLNILCPGVPHEQNPDRVAAANSLISTDGVDAIVMDDGFQHRRLRRDLEIVLIDATNPFGYGHLLPRGLLREPLMSLRRADVVVITRSDLVGEQVLSEIERSILNAAPKLKNRILQVVFQPTVLRAADGNKISIQSVADQPVHLMAGIGNPDAFLETTRRIPMQVTGTSWFADHHHYSQEDLSQVRANALESGAGKIITTLKDLVKLPKGCEDVLALEIAAVFPNPQHLEVLRDLLNGAVRQPSAP
ncbi:MAG TPA: tetraacyldisaccharide 4'-kinase [Planctomycetaceae bacterium]|nr:tetraacyldisaccharide 4'-kinase [Planctomycetaceae bacterium]